MIGQQRTIRREICLAESSGSRIAKCSLDKLDDMAQQIMYVAKVHFKA